METLTLNDVKKNAAPLSLVEPDNDYKVDENTIRDLARKNKELMMRLEDEYNQRKELGRQIV